MRPERHWHIFSDWRINALLHGFDILIRRDLKNKAFAYIQLVRLPNIFTAMADILAGYFIVFDSSLETFTLAGLLLATSAIYGGGCALNDVRDCRIDAEERPDRPIPSGRVSVREARTLAWCLFGIGLLGAVPAGLLAMLIAAFLVGLVISYDCLTKETTFLGPLNMGSCRALNLLLGMSSALSWGLFLLFPLFSLVYVFAVTTLSKFETGGRPGLKGLFVLGAVVVISLALSYLTISKHMALDSLIFLVIFLACIIFPLLKGITAASPSAVGTAVKWMVLAIPVLNAVYVSGVQGYIYGIPVILCLVPAFLIARYIYVT